MVVVRVSKVTFPREKLSEFSELIKDSESRLVPGLRQLAGNLHYWAGIDEATSSMVNVSVWETLESARQMDTFQPMLELAREASAMGATFERPIPNFTVEWSMESSG